jgi:hypothetical protein
VTAVTWADRAATYAAETAPVPTPVLLPRLLASTRSWSLAEAPAGVGHFLDSYAVAGWREITLIDAEPAMLTEAVGRAATYGLTAHPVRTRIQDLAALGHRYDAIVVPNAALNMLAAQTTPAATLTALRGALRPGGMLLGQFLGVHQDGTLDRSGCFDPDLPDGAWTEEWHRPTTGGRSLTRRRRQHRAGPDLTIEIELALTVDDAEPAHHQIALRLLALADLPAQCRAAGFGTVVTRPGTHGMSELLVAVPRGGQHR